jgi:hypothetical protein
MPEEVRDPGKATPLVNNFSAGELDPEVDARADIDKYYSGCRIMENFLPLIEGGAMRAPGLQYIAYAKNQGPS